MRRCVAAATSALALLAAVVVSVSRAAAQGTCGPAAPQDAVQIAMAGDPTHGPVIGEVAGDGTAAWVQEGSA